MTRAAFIGSKQRARAETCTLHSGCCKVHTVKRACGHTDKLHENSRNPSGANTRLRFWRETPCDDCQIMAEQGITILDNHPTFAAL